MGFSAGKSGLYKENEVFSAIMTVFSGKSHRKCRISDSRVSKPITDRKFRKTVILVAKTKRKMPKSSYKVSKC